MGWGEPLLSSTCSNQAHAFLVADAPRVERLLRQRDAEIEALRSLVRDFVAAAVPNLPSMHPDLWQPETWQYRARRVTAGLSIAKEVPTA